MTKDRRVIWSDIHLDFEDWRTDLEEQYPGLPDDELIQAMYEINSDNLYDERMNLNIQLSQPIIVIGDIGRWNGRVLGYKMIDSGNIKDCLYSDTDYNEWYLDEHGDLRAEAVHHDGTNYYLYRTLKEGLTEDEIDDFQIKIIDNELTEDDIEKYTDSIGQYVCGIYGWQ